MDTLEQMNKKLEDELNLIRKELGVEQLELKEEQQILPLLLKVKSFLQHMFSASKGMYMGPYGDIGGILSRLDQLIVLLKKDEKELWTIMKEDRAQIGELMVGRKQRLKDFKGGGYNENFPEPKIRAMQEFKLVRNIEKQKVHFTKEHINTLHQMQILFIEINNYLSRWCELLTPAMTRAFKELRWLFGQLEGLAAKEEEVLQTEVSEMR